MRWPASYRLNLDTLYDTLYNTLKSNTVFNTLKYTSPNCLVCATWTGTRKQAFRSCLGHESKVMYVTYSVHARLTYIPALLTVVPTSLHLDLQGIGSANAQSF